MRTALFPNGVDRDHRLLFAAAVHRVQPSVLGEDRRVAVAQVAAPEPPANEGGGEKYTSRHIARGRILPRKRIEMLLDHDSFFLEIAPLAGHGMKGEVSGSSVVGGVGIVSGVECGILASEATVKGGAISPISIVAAMITRAFLRP